MELVRNPPSTKEAANLAARFAVVKYRHDDSEQTETYDLSQDYFRFMFAEQVEPTNNHSEQQIRHCVIDRRITQGTRSEAGMRYHERMWTMIATCKKQNHRVFTFLQESISAKLSGTTAVYPWKSVRIRGESFPFLFHPVPAVSLRSTAG